MKFEHLFSPMQVGSKTYRNRIVSAPMAFGLIVQNPEARDFTYRKLEASAKGGNGCVIVGETDVNFTDAVRIPGFRPFDFAKPEEDMDMYDDKVTPGYKVVMVGGGLVGCEAGLYLQKTGHEVTVVEMLDRLANEAFGMYREALIWEMEKWGMGMLPKTRCLEITPSSVKVENADGVQVLEADTVLFALGMKTWTIGDAIQPVKVDQATRSGYLAGIEVGE